MANFGSVIGTLRHNGYGLLSIDGLHFGDDNATASQQSKDQLVPPARTPMFTEDTAGAYKTRTLSRTWYIFFEQLGELFGAGGPGSLTQIQVFAPSIDEEDILLWGTGSIDATSDPATFTPDSLEEESRYGIHFKVGDYIIWNDDTVDDAGYKKYEIDQIAAINQETGEWTLKRHEDTPDALAGEAHFHSLLSSHEARTFYRLVPQWFTFDLISGRLPELVQWPWANKCVAALRSWGVSSLGDLGPMNTINLAQDHVPGWRTMNGAAYCNLGVAGTLEVNQRAAYRVGVQAWESVRCVYASVKTPPTGHAVVVAVIYIEPGDVEASRICGLIDRITIPAGAYRSWTTDDPPDHQQLPYNASFPPNLLGNVGALGGLTPPLGVVGLSGPVLFHPDGEIDFVIEAVGSDTAGADLIVTVQT